MTPRLKLAASFVAGAFASALLFLVAFFVATDPGDNLTLTAGLTSGPGGAHAVTGTLRNNTDRSYARVVADVDFVDAEGRLVERAFATTADLAAGEAWRFKVAVPAEEVVGAVVHGQCGRDYWFRAAVGAVPDDR